MLATHVPGNSFLHRASAGWKLAGLAALAIALVAVPGPYGAPIITAVIIMVALASRVRWRAISLPVTVAIVTGSGLAAFHYFFSSAAAAIRVSTSLIALVLAASLVTTTTAIDEMLDLLARAAQPVSRFPLVRRTGFTAEKFALAVAVMLRAIPVILLLARQTRQAAIARGLNRSPRALIVPVVVRTVRHAQRTSEALAARGLD